MSERRTPYTTRGLPRTDEPTHQAHQRVAELDAENEALLRQSLERAEETGDLRRRVAALEAAAREVCRAHRWAPVTLDRAIEELGRLVEVQTL